MVRIDEHTTPAVHTASSKRDLDPAQKTRLQKAVKDFEAVLVGLMLKNMRGSLQKEGMFGESFGGDLMDSMFDTEMAKEVSSHSSFGIARTLYRQITGEEMPKMPTSVTELQPLASAGTPIRGARPKTVPPAPPAPVQPPVVAPAAEAKPAILELVSAKPAAADRSHVAVAPVPNETEAKRATAGGMSAKTKGRIDAYASIIDTAAEKHGLDPNLVRAVIATESAGKATARSSKNAKGLMQLIDTTAAEVGVRNVWDPEENINGGVKYLKKMLERFDGDVKLAVASYNAGPGAVEKHKGVPPYRETRDYVNRVMRYLELYTQEAGSQNE